MTAVSAPRRGVFKALFSRALHAYFLLTRGLTLGVRVIVRAGDGRFLLVRHTYTPGWHFPGGGVEKGESTVSAVENELRQETGLTLAGMPRLHGVFHNSCVNRRDHILVYRCDVEGRVQTEPRSPEIAEIGFFDPADLPPDIDPGTHRRIREILEGSTPSRTW